MYYIIEGSLLELWGDTSMFFLCSIAPAKLWRYINVFSLINQITNGKPLKMEKPPKLVIHKVTTDNVIKSSNSISVAEDVFRGKTRKRD